MSHWIEEDEVSEACAHRWLAMGWIALAEQVYKFEGGEKVVTEQHYIITSVWMPEENAF